MGRGNSDTVVSLMGPEDELVRYFNANTVRPRLLALLSPT